VFDLRYHVASLAAVFVALVIGIFVGVGLSGQGFVDDAERANLQASIDGLRAERDAAVQRASLADVRGAALDDFAETAYPELVAGRLEGKAVGVVFVGSVDQSIAGTIRRSVADAGGRVARMRALRVPLDTESVDEALRADPDLRDLAGADRREHLGRELARELVAGGPAPILRRLSATLVEEQSGITPIRLDAVVVARPARPQQGATQDFLTGLYGGLAAAPIPSVGVDVRGTERSPLLVFRRRGLSTVEAIDEAAGRIALVYVLAGARPGSYGMGPDAVDGVLPAAPPPPQPADG
jgi:Copper transport outer membrane protein, MctB